MVAAGVAICLERGADLSMAQLMPLPLIVSWFSKIQIGFTFLVPAHPGSPGKSAAKRVSCRRRVMHDQCNQCDLGYILDCTESLQLSDE